MTNTADKTERTNAERGSGTHYLSDTAIAARFGVTRQAIWRWAKAGTFPAPIKLTPGCTRWRLADVEAWEASR